MSSPLRAGRTTLRGVLRASVVRLNREQQARIVQRRLREARAPFDAELRRHLRDEHAMQVILASVLRTDSNAIDVGANEGSVLAAISRIAPAGRHIAYEPVPELHELLRARYPDVDVRRAALYDEVGEASFVHVLDAPTRSGLRQRADLGDSAERVRRITVPTERLDDALDRDYAPALIKIDVEGAELHVLRGAVETLSRHRPHVLFEHGVGGADLYDTQPAQVFDLLDGCGLRIFDLDGIRPYSRAQFEATFPEPIWNFLAAPG